MKQSLFLRTLAALLAGLLVFAALLFLPAGSIAYPGAWLLTGLLFIPMTITGLVLFFKNPQLLEKRLASREKQPEQKNVILLSALMFILGFILAGLDFRFGWSRIGTAVRTGASAVFLLGYGMYAEVLRENTWLSRTVEVQNGQKLIDSGLYGVVRHPMYTSSLLMFLSMPLVLGSFPAFILFLAYPVLIVKRIKNEEAILSDGLKGYADYMQRVRYRLIPFLW